MLTATDAIEKRSALSGFIIERTAKRMKQACQHYLTLAGIDITVDQWVLLQELSKADGQGQHELALKTFKDPPTVTRIIDLLCKKGLTTRRGDPDDRRKFNIFLTPKGQSTIEEVLPVIRQFRLRAYQNLSDPEIEQLSDLLDKIFNNFEC